jgi:hypothetical protein
MGERVPRDWPAVIELFKRIHTDCEAVAAAFGIEPPENEGFAAIAFTFRKLITAARNVSSEPDTVANKRDRKSGPHEATKQFVRDWDEIYAREKQYQRANLKTLAKWIAELKNNERTGKTESGKLSALEIEQIRDYRLRLEEKLAALKSKKSKTPKIGTIRESVAEGFVRAGTYGRPRGGQDDVAFIDEKVKRARRSIRGKRRRKPTRK